MQNYKVSTKTKTLSVEKVVPAHLLKQGFNWVVYEYSAKTTLQNAYWLADYPDFKNVAPLLAHAKQNCLLNNHFCVIGATTETAEVIATAKTQSQEQETEEEKKETVLTVRLEKELANSFTESCQEEGKTKAKKTRELIENYTKTMKKMKTEAEMIEMLKSEIERLNCDIQDSDFVQDMYNRGYLFGYLYALQDSVIISKSEFNRYNNLLIEIIKEQ